MAVCHKAFIAANVKYVHIDKPNNRAYAYTFNVFPPRTGNWWRHLCVVHTDI